MFADKSAVSLGRVTWLGTLIALTKDTTWLEMPKKKWPGTCLRLGPNDLSHLHVAC